MKWESAFATSYVDETIGSNERTGNKRMRNRTPEKCLLHPDCAAAMLESALQSSTAGEGARLFDVPATCVY